MEVLRAVLMLGLELPVQGALSAFLCAAWMLSFNSRDIAWVPSLSDTLLSPDCHFLSFSDFPPPKG